jgi:hypothetical protein
MEDGGKGGLTLRMLVQLGKFVSTSDSARHPGPPHGHADARLGTGFVRLVIVESGSTGLGATAADDGTSMVAIAQGDGEAAPSFAARVVRRILALERGQQSIERTVLFLGRRFEPDFAQARLTIARALITHSATLGRSPEIVLDASGESRDELQLEIPALVNALIGESASGALSIAVKLERRA